MSIDNVTGGLPITADWGNSVADELNRVGSAVAVITEVVTVPSTPTEFDITGLAVTLTVPADRRVIVAFDLGWDFASGTHSIQLRENTTTLGRWMFLGQTSPGLPLSGSVVLAPSAGSHTWRLVHRHEVGTTAGFIIADPTFPAHLIAYDIGPAV